MNFDFVINVNSNIVEALKKMTLNESGCVIVTDFNGYCLGSLTDGDIRKKLLEGVSLEKINLKDVINREFFFTRPNQILDEELLKRYRLIPIIDQNKKVIGIHSSQKKFRIGKTSISKRDKTFIIAEIGNNHQGDVGLGKKLIDAAKDAGADAVKFQHRHLDELYRQKEIEDLGVEYTKNLLKKYSLKWNDLKKLLDYGKEKNLSVICTPFDEKSAIEIISYGIDAIKIASADLTNHNLIKICGSSGIPLIVSTGMSSENEIFESSIELKKQKSQFSFLHCNSTYPAPFEDINLKFLRTLMGFTEIGIVGWSGHERGHHVCIGAVTLGAKIIEKHLTLDKHLEGNDHNVSLTPFEFKKMVSDIRELEIAFGSANRTISQGEMINRENLSKSIVAKRNIKKGEIVNKNLIEFRSPGRGMQPNKLNEILGKKINIDINKGDFFYPSHFIKKDKLEIINVEGIDYGIPVRFHDIDHSLNIGNLVEFHLTYEDLHREELIKKISLPSNIKKFTVHAPELFSEDNLLDLSKSDKDSKLRSIENLNKVIRVVELLQETTGIYDRTKIIVNAGGFSKENFIESEKKKEELYANVAAILANFESEKYEILIQTMPPYPWHFGGQSFHNLFLAPDEIIRFCKDQKIRICLDISHTYLATTFFDIDFFEAINKLIEFTGHLHLSDAKALNGEGLEIGEGEINWEKLLSLIFKSNNQISLIPEIWQGHKNTSEGAITNLKKVINVYQEIKNPK